MIENRRERRISWPSTAAERRAMAASGTRAGAASSLGVMPVSMATRQRDERHRQHLSRHDRAVVALLDQHQLLSQEWRADRNHHPAARLELTDQRRRDVARRGGDDDRVERSAVFPTVV